jgi:rare lipoprotein A
MTLPAATPARKYIRSSRRFLLASMTLLGAIAHAKADPRIDSETASAYADPSGPGAVIDKPLASAAVVEQQGIASWYGRAWRGRRTASGQRFDERLLTAASLSLPLATRARVTNLQNGRFVDVIVNDRGPYAAGRIIDLSAGAAAVLGMLHSGTAQVAIRALLAPVRAAG